MTEMIDLLTRTLPIVFGGGIVQIIVILIKRRTEMRAADVAAKKVDHESDAVVVASAERSLILSDQVRDRAVKRAEQLTADLSHAEGELAALRVEAREARLEVASLHREVANLSARLSAVSG